MMTMKWNVGTKLGVGFGLTLVIFLSVGVVSYRSTTQLVASDFDLARTFSDPKINCA